MLFDSDVSMGNRAAGQEWLYPQQQWLFGIAGSKKIAMQRVQLHGLGLVLFGSQNRMREQKPTINAAPANRWAAALKQVVLQLLELETVQDMIAF
jgi:hypothetical protein